MSLRQIRAAFGLAGSRALPQGVVTPYFFVFLAGNPPGHIREVRFTMAAPILPAVYVWVGSEAVVFEWEYIYRFSPGYFPLDSIGRRSGSHVLGLLCPGTSPPPSTQPARTRWASSSPKRALKVLD